MPSIQLRFVHKYRTRHGKDILYFRRPAGPRIRLPADQSSKAFDMAYKAALSGNPIPHVRNMPLTIIASRKQSTERTLKRALRAAKARSAAKGLPFALSLDWALERVEAQGFRCAVTGIEFFAAHSSPGKANPYIPSLDRIDCSLGYTPENVRIVIFALNAMLNDWGTDIFEQVANSYRYTQAKGRRLYANP